MLAWGARLGDLPFLQRCRAGTEEPPGALPRPAAVLCAAMRSLLRGRGCTTRDCRTRVPKKEQRRGKGYLLGCQVCVSGLSWVCGVFLVKIPPNLEDITF